VIKKEIEKILKFKDLTIEIQCIRNVKIKVIPVIIEATRTISKLFRKYLDNLQGKHDTKELQKTTILGTAHTHARSLARSLTQSTDVKYNTYLAYKITLHVAQIVNTEKLQHYVP
jgi:type I site-specific restriction endonuclease